MEKSWSIFLKNLHAHLSAVSAVVILVAIVAAISLTLVLQQSFHHAVLFAPVSTLVSEGPSSDVLSESRQFAILAILAAARATTTAQNATTTPVSATRQDVLLDTMARARNGDNTVPISEMEKTHLLDALATPQYKKI